MHTSSRNAASCAGVRSAVPAVKPEEREFVTGELIRDTSFTATEAVLKERVAAMRDAGYTQFTVQLTPGHDVAIEDWARIMRAFR